MRERGRRVREKAKKKKKDKRNRKGKEHRIDFGPYNQIEEGGTYQWLGRCENRLWKRGEGRGGG